MKHIKVIFYIASIIVVGMVTMYEIVSMRSALISANGFQVQAELEKVKEVVSKWTSRPPFEFRGEIVSTQSAEKPTLTITPAHDASLSSEEVETSN